MSTYIIVHVVRYSFPEHGILNVANNISVTHIQVVSSNVSIWALLKMTQVFTSPWSISSGDGTILWWFASIQVFRRSRFSMEHTIYHRKTNTESCSTITILDYCNNGKTIEYDTTILGFPYQIVLAD